MRPWLNTTVNSDFQDRGPETRDASMRPWLNTTVNSMEKVALRRFSTRFNEAVAQHHGEHIEPVCRS